MGVVWKCSAKASLSRHGRDSLRLGSAKREGTVVSRDGVNSDRIDVGLRG